MRRKARVIEVHACDETAQVVTVLGDKSASYSFRRDPCAECPWRMDQPVGRFPVEAYRHSAGTSYDMAQTTFACHMAGASRPQTCAGFLLSSGAVHNMNLRMAAIRDAFDWGSVRSDVDLYGSYREMAEANGVERDDPVLRPCR